MEMKIGIISDTHGKTACIDEALTIFGRFETDLIIHCGDWATPDTALHFRKVSLAAGIPVKGVLGNNDHETGQFLALNTTGFELTEGVLELEYDRKSMAAYHGHHPPTLRRLLSGEHDVLLLGHSHKPRYDVMPPRIVLNPGSTAFAIPRSKTWKPSVAIYDTESHQAEFVYFTVL